MVAAGAGGRWGAGWRLQAGAAPPTQGPGQGPVSLVDSFGPSSHIPFLVTMFPVNNAQSVSESLRLAPELCTFVN